MSKYGTEGSNDRETEYGTPVSFIRPISDSISGFDLDPASGAETEKHADTCYTEEDDGLSKNWFGNVWCNPPFSDKQEWIEHAWEQHQDGNTDLILLLLPVDTSTGWVHEYITEANLIWFKEKRLNFDGSDGWQPNFGVMIVIFGEPTEELLYHLMENGCLMHTVSDPHDKQEDLERWFDV